MSEAQPLPIIPYAEVAPAKPGILTAMAVLSIVIGSLAILTNLCSALQPLSFMMLRSMSMPATTRTVVAFPTTSPVAPSGPTDAATVYFSPTTSQTPVSVPAGTATTMPVTNPFAGMSLTPMVVRSAMALAELGLGGYLLAAGILLARNRPSARRHHLRYAVLKCPVAFLAAAAGGWMEYEMQSAIFGNMPAGPGSPMPMAFVAPMALIMAGFWLVLSLAYPVAVLIVLTRPGVKAYCARLIST